VSELPHPKLLHLIGYLLQPVLTPGIPLHRQWNPLPWLTLYLSLPNEAMMGRCLSIPGIRGWAPRYRLNWRIDWNGKIAKARTNWFYVVIFSLMSMTILMVLCLDRLKSTQTLSLSKSTKSKLSPCSGISNFQELFCVNIGSGIRLINHIRP